MTEYQLAQELIHCHFPEAHLQPQPSSHWTGPTSLPESVMKYDSQLGPHDLVLDGYGNSYFFPRLAHLWDFQAGYSYHAITGETISDWNLDWLVIGNQGGDPFILSRSTGEVLFAQHGIGVWKPVTIFSGLNEMISCIASLAAIVREAGMEFTDEGSLIRPIYYRRAVEQLEQIVHSNGRAAEILGVFEWSTPA